MSFYPSRSLRLSTLAVLAATVAILALLIAPTVSSAAASCKKGQAAWKVNGKRVCLRTAKPKSSREALAARTQLKKWFVGETARQQTAKIKAPRQLKSVAGPASKIAVKLLDQAAAKLAAGTPAKKLSPLSLVRASAAAGRVVTETMSVEAGSVTLDNGVKVTARVDARAYDDGDTSADVTIEAEKDGVRVQYKPSAASDIKVIPSVECPDAEGQLFLNHNSSVGGTTIFLKKGRVIGAFTQRDTQSFKSRGLVGRDARLREVEVTSTLKYEVYSRGMQVVTTLTGSYKIPGEGDPVATGPVQAETKAKVAGWSNAKEAAEARRVADEAASDPGIQGSVMSNAELARWQMKQDEYKWYTIPNSCAQIEYSPDTIALLAEGQSTAVEGVVTARGGAQAHGEFTVQSVERGTFASTKAQSDPGSPATFAARGADKRDADDLTVGSEVIATSTAGRASMGWYAKATPVDVPKRLEGIVDATTTGPGAYSYFHSWVEYELESVNVGPGGYVSAWYNLVVADQDEVINVIGQPGGCRYEAKGSGGVIADGDVELRRPPGGQWTHAVMYDVELADQIYSAMDCGPDPPPSFTGDLVGFLNMAMIGRTFEPVQDNFTLQGVALSHTEPATQRMTTGSWLLEPAAE